MLKHIGFNDDFEGVFCKKVAKSVQGYKNAVALLHNARYVRVPRQDWVYDHSDEIGAAVSLQGCRSLERFAARCDGDRLKEQAGAAFSTLMDNT